MNLKTAQPGHFQIPRPALHAARKPPGLPFLDNFGTGYSSLYHLRNFKLDKIKIDRSFIDTLASQESAGIVNALVGLGHGLGLTIVADGVEASEQRTSLLTTGCEQGQGFFFSKAVPANETLAFFHELSNVTA